MLLGAGAAIFVGRFESFVEVTFGPLKAKMKQTIAEANATLDQLKEIAAMSASAMLTDAMGSNFWDGMTVSRMLSIYDSIIRSLRKIEVSETQMQEVTKEWNKGVALLYQRGLHEKALLELPQDKAQNFISQWTARNDIPEWQAITPNQIEALFAEFQVTPSEGMKTALGHYRHFLQTGEIRNREEFVSY